MTVCVTARVIMIQSMSTVTAYEVNARVEELISKKPNTSVRKGAQILEFNHMNVHKILVDNLQMLTYKIQV